MIPPEFWEKLAAVLSNELLLLNWAVLTVSFYNTISLLWLGVMVLLVGNRRSPGSWLTSAGLLLGALFFTSHTAILGRGLAETSFGMTFWWWVSWTPAVVAPLAWYAAMFWYASAAHLATTFHRLSLAAASGLAVFILLMVIFTNPLPNYMYVAGRVIVTTPTIAGIPMLIVFYLAFSIYCYTMPIHMLLGRHRAVSSPVDQSHRLARPWLVGASVAMLLAGLMLAWTALWALGPLPAIGLGDPSVERAVKLFDVTVSSLVGIAITLLGRAIVSYEVFIGRPLPRNRFFHQWRSTVLLAIGFGTVASALLVIELRPIYSLMMAVTLMALFYALYSWRSYAERERFMANLRPFLSSQNLYGRLTSADNPADSTAPRLFETLCRDILGVQQAGLVPIGSLAALAGPPLLYPPDSKSVPPSIAAWSTRFRRGTHCLPVEHNPGGWMWAVPLWSPQGLAGVLFLGEKSSGGVFSEEEVELAQTGGERLLDMQAGSEMARLSMDLLRRRLAQQRVLEGQGRRVLHDEILPELHTAILYLGGQPNPTPENRQAVETLSAAHRRIADLLHAAGPSAPTRLAQDGLVAALRSLLETDLAGEFSEVCWHITPAAEARAKELPLFAAEVIYFAAREVTRNAARYGRGGDRRRRLALTIALEETAAGKLRLRIADDGVGLNQAAQEDELEQGAGSGLRIHSAMLAAVGASLELGPSPSGGAQAVIEF